MRGLVLTILICGCAFNTAAQQPTSPSEELAATEQSASALLVTAEAGGSPQQISEAAIGLARLRLRQNRRQEALAPARRALELAENGVGDPVLAQLLVGRAEILTTWRARDRLHEVIQEAAGREDLYADLYLAASELGRAQLQADRLAQAVQSWTVAERAASAAPTDPDLARARALIMQAVALIYYFPDRNGRHATDIEVLAHEKLHQATRIIVARNEPPSVAGEDMTAATRVQLLAITWHGLLSARLTSELPDGPPWRGEDRVATGLANPLDGQCAYDLVPGEMPRFPRSAANDAQIASVMVRFHINENDAIVRREIAIAAPDRQEFIDAVARVVDSWTVRREPDAQSDCAPGGVLASAFTFGFEASLHN